MAHLLVFCLIPYLQLSATASGELLSPWSASEEDCSWNDAAGVQGCLSGWEDRVLSFRLSWKAPGYFLQADYCNGVSSFPWHWAGHEVGLCYAVRTPCRGRNWGSDSHSWHRLSKCWSCSLWRFWSYFCFALSSGNAWSQWSRICSFGWSTRHW